MIDFSPLWKTMEQKGVTQYQLIKNGIDNKTLDTLKRIKYHVADIAKALPHFGMRRMM